MNDLEAVKRSIINGLGISILSAKSVQDLKASRQVLIFPLAHPAPTRSLYIVYRKEHALRPMSDGLYSLSEVIISLSKKTQPAKQMAGLYNKHVDYRDPPSV